MIRPPGMRAAFSESADGDMRHDQSARDTLSHALGVSPEWATVKQVHGKDVTRVETAGDHGEFDGVWTTAPQLPIAILTADCFGVVVEADGAVGVAHAGWRGAAAGVIARLVDEMTNEGYPPRAAAVGPGIGPCCFEVGGEVADRFPGHVTRTSWGNTSVDLPQSIVMQLGELRPWMASQCTYHGEGWFSYRADHTDKRLATVAWV